MAVTLALPPDITKTAHADATAVQYDVNPKTNRVTVYIAGQAGEMALTGTDGGALGAGAWPLLADTAFTFRLDSGEDRVAGLQFFLAADAAADVHVFSESD